jgi:ribosome-binding factor A
VSRRTERVASLIRSVVADAIHNRLSDPRIESLTSITRVEVSADLSVAHVYVSVMAEEPRQKLSVQALRHASGRLRSLVAEQVVLRQAPALDFRLDGSVQGSFQTVQQIDRIMEELDSRTASAGDRPVDVDATGHPEIESLPPGGPIQPKRTAGRESGADQAPGGQEDA